MGPATNAVTATACANIALVKYWGKRTRVGAHNLPAAGSLSLTLSALTTTTTVEFVVGLAEDELVLDGKVAAAAERARTSAWLDQVRARASLTTRARVVSHNDFPTASGLASSASGYAALALAASRAAGLALDDRALSILAREGSGSAARSVFGGLVRMHAGASANGDDAFAEPIPGGDELASGVRMVIAVVGGGQAKTWGSRDAMEHCAETSPLHAAWLALVPRDLAAAESAIAAGDLEALGAIAEGNALAMHADAMAARPAIVYWQPPTLAVLATVRALRAGGTGAWATMDAGPHVKVLTRAADADGVAAAVGEVPGVTAVTISGPGGPARVIATSMGG